jgi:hypothetical protein
MILTGDTCARHGAPPRDRGKRQGRQHAAWAMTRRRRCAGPSAGISGRRPARYVTRNGGDISSILLPCHPVTASRLTAPARLPNLSGIRG